MTEPASGMNLPLRAPVPLDARGGRDSAYLVLAALAVILGVLMILHNGFQLKSDGSNYFAYLRSAVFDRDLDFHNEFARFDKAFWDTYKPRATATGHLTNVFSVGPAILWAPFYLAAHLAVLIANLFGAGIKPDGFSPPYLLAVNIASVAYSFTGMCLVYSMCRKYWGRWPALAATITVWLSTFITYYTVCQPYMSHTVSFFAVTLFVYSWDSTRDDRSQARWILLGLSAGLMMLVRWQNGLFMILPAGESLAGYRAAIREAKLPDILKLLKNNLLFLASALAGFLPQSAAWKAVYGSFFTIPQGTGFLRWSEPFPAELLFSSRHGLFSWSPVVYLAAAGWFVFLRRDRLLAVWGLAAFVLMAYVNSVISDWWAGWGFGMRRFDGFILFFALGLAALFDWQRNFSPRRAYIVSVAILIFFTCFNILLIQKFGREIHPGGPVSFSKVLGLKADGIYRYTGYPFAFPANFAFALQYKQSPARYDTLVGGYIDDRYFYGDTIRPAMDGTLLGAGWSGPVSYNGINCRTVNREALVFVPVRTVTGFTLKIRAAGINLPPQGISVYLNGQPISTVNLTAVWQEYRMKLPENRLGKGINILSLVNAGGSGRFAVEYLNFKRLEYVPDWK